MGNRGWDFFKLVVGLIPAVLSLIISYSVYLHGPPEQEKHLALDEIGPTDFNDYVTLFGNPDKLGLSLKFKNRPVSNLIIIQGTLRNVGSAPIEKSDYSQNLSVSIAPPWKILSVENKTSPILDIPLTWKRVSDQQFEAEPALLNSGDFATAIVYLTNTQPPATGASQKAAKPQLQWNVRIPHLRGLETLPDSFQRYQSRHFGIEVQLIGWGLPFAIVVALTFQALYLHFLIRSRFLPRWGWDWRFIAAALATSLISFAAAESMATYIWGNDTTIWSGVNHWLNAPPIILHVVVLTLLWWTARAARRAV